MMPCPEPPSPDVRAHVRAAARSSLQYLLRRVWNYLRASDFDGLNGVIT